MSVPRVFCEKLVLLSRTVILLGQQLHNGGEKCHFPTMSFFIITPRVNGSEFKMCEKINRQVSS